MKTFLSISLIMSCLLWSGCKDSARDPWSTGELAKTHPLIKQVCDIAGGCDKVTVECRRYDDIGNTSIRNKTFIDIDADFDSDLGNVNGWASASNGTNVGSIIDRAVDDWLSSYRYNKVGEKHVAITNPIIYPNVSKCGADCLK